VTPAAATRAIVLDVEGTTTPIDFVYSTLFPYARRHMESYLSSHWDDDLVRAAVDDLVVVRRSEGDNAPPIADGSGEPTVSATTAFAHWLMDGDRKTTALKTLQGLIWEEGYEAGELASTLFDDVAPAFERWSRAGIRVASYSSGSIRAQQLLYRHTTAGDLSRFVESYFDTTSGAKGDRASYERIAASLNLEPAEVVYISDVVTELDAAAAAGLRPLLAIRPGNRAQPRSDEYEIVATFADVLAG
jgi:enolase-phosphatase E1